MFYLQYNFHFSLICYERSSLESGLHVCNYYIGKRYILWLIKPWCTNQEIPYHHWHDSADTRLWRWIALSTGRAKFASTSVTLKLSQIASLNYAQAFCIGRDTHDAKVGCNRPVKIRSVGGIVKYEEKHLYVSILFLCPAPLIFAISISNNSF